jgi:predicted RNA binding protein YcfA (HicA-like mRNA interferase family)
MSGRSDADRERRNLERQGWSFVRRTSTGHLLYQAPTGQRMTLPISPSDSRWLKNTRATVRRQCK